MFTIEMDQDETLITVLDDSGNRDDVSIFLYDDMVYVRQYDNRKEQYTIISMTAKMWNEVMEAWNQPEGAYVVR